MGKEQTRQQPTQQEIQREMLRRGLIDSSGLEQEIRRRNLQVQPLVAQPRREGKPSLGQSFSSGFFETGASAIEGVPIVGAVVAQNRAQFAIELQKAREGTGVLSGLAEAVRGMAPDLSEKEEGNFFNKVMQGLGSTTVFALASLAALAGGPHAAAVGGLTAGLTGALVAAGGTARELEAEGVEDPNIAVRTAILNMAGGLTEGIPVSRGVNTLLRATKAPKVAVRLAEGVVEEGGQEALQSFLSNLGMGRELGEGVGESAAVGGVVGGLMNAVLAALGARRRGRIGRVAEVNSEELESLPVDRLFAAGDQAGLEARGRGDLSFAVKRDAAEAPAITQPLKEAFRLSDEQADAVAALFDARAETWAREHGKEKDDWYNEKIAGVQKGEVFAGDVRTHLLQSLWHGSPHKFEKFSTEYVGVGEGTQFEGWGLYFTEKKDVAKWYARNLGAKTNIKLRGESIRRPPGGVLNPESSIEDFVSSFLYYEERYPYASAEALKESVVYSIERDIELLVDFISDMVPGRPWHEWEGISHSFSFSSEETDELLFKFEAAIRYIEGLKEGELTVETGRNIYEADILDDLDFLVLDEVVPEAIQHKIAEKLEYDPRALSRVLTSGYYRGNTGDTLYRNLAKHLGSDKEASLFLMDIGVSGLRYPGDEKKGLYNNYIIFDDSLVTMKASEVFQINDGDVKGAVEFLEDGRSMIKAFRGADVSTAIHELGHVLRKDLVDADTKLVENWAGVKEGVWTREAEEKFARGFERYIYNGKAPTRKLEQVFLKLKNWLVEIYGKVSKSPLVKRMSPEVVDVFDRLLGKGLDRGGRPNWAIPAKDPEVRALIDLVQTQRFEGGDPELQSHEQWDEAAESLLKEDYESQAWLMRQNKLDLTFNPVHVKMAQKIIDREGVEAITAGDAARIIEFSEVILGNWIQAGTQTARALAARIDPLQTPAERARSFVLRAVMTPSDSLYKALEVTEDVGRKKQIWAEHAKEVERLRNDLHTIGFDLGSVDWNNMPAVATILRAVQTHKADFDKKIYEYWISIGLLSSPTTQLANILGNTASAVWELGPQRATEAALNLFFKNKQGASFGEYKEIWRALSSKGTWGRAWENMTIAWEVEAPIYSSMMAAASKLDQAEGHKWDFGSKKAIKGEVGRKVRIPLRSLVAADEYFKTMITETEVGARAVRNWKAMENPTVSLEEYVEDQKSKIGSLAYQQAFQEAIRLTFQERTRFTIKAAQWRETVPALKWVVPFVTTPSNIIRVGVRKSPFGTGSLLTKSLKHIFYKRGVSQNGNWYYGASAFQRDLAEQLLAWGVTCTLMGLIGDDDSPIEITGSQAKYGDPEKTTELRVLPATSIRIGKTYLNYSRLEPLGTSLAVLVDLIKAHELDPSDEKMAQVFKAARAAVLDQHFLMGLADIVRASENERDITRWAGNVSISFVPNIVRHLGRATDPYVRDYSIRAQQGEWFSKFREKTKARAFPGIVKPPVPKVDIWGREITRRTWGPVTDFIYQMTVPVQARRIDPTIGDKVILAWNRNNQGNEWHPLAPRPYGSIRGREYIMSDEAYNEYLRRSGSLAASIVRNRSYDYENPTVQDVEFIQTALIRARSAVRRQMIAEGKFDF